MIETDKNPTPKPVTRGSKDPNSVAPIHPDPSLQPDTVFHGGSGKTPPPSDPIGTGPKLSTKILNVSQHGRAVHDAASSSVDHQPAGSFGDQPAPVKTKGGSK